MKQSDEMETMYQEKPVEKIGKEEKEKEKPQDLTDGEELFNIDIENQARGIKVSIKCEDSGDAVFMAGFVTSAFRKLGVETKSKVMP